MSREVAMMAARTKSCSSLVTRIVGRCVSRLAVAFVLAAVIVLAVWVGYAAAVGVSSPQTSGSEVQPTLPPGHPDVQLLPPGHPPIDAIPGQPKQDPTTGGPVYEL
jgi:hypothetical protein